MCIIESLASAINAYTKIFKFEIGKLGDSTAFLVYHYPSKWVPFIQLKVSFSSFATLIIGYIPLHQLWNPIVSLKRPTTSLKRENSYMAAKSQFVFVRFEYTIYAVIPIWLVI